MHTYGNIDILYEICVYQSVVREVKTDHGLRGVFSHVVPGKCGRGHVNVKRENSALAHSCPALRDAGFSSYFSSRKRVPLFFSSLL